MRRSVDEERKTRRKVELGADKRGPDTIRIARHGKRPKQANTTAKTANDDVLS